MQEPGEHDQRLDPGRQGSVTIRIALPVDLEATLDGGQAFRWWREGDAYRGVVGRRVYRLSERASNGTGLPGPMSDSNVVVVEAVDGRPVADTDLAVLRRYLGLEYDFAGFVSRFATDRCIGPALAGWPGLRVLRQDRWECLVAFICSSTSNIPRIKRDVNSIVINFGDRIGSGPYDFAFPSPRCLAEAGEMSLRKLGLGFHAKYVARAAETANSGELDLDVVGRLPYDMAVAALDELDGVGRKIADCTLAFAFDMPEAFPVDRWVKRALEEWYGIPVALSMEKTAAWARARFGRDATYVNQYLFHRQRLMARRVILPEVG